MQDIDKTKEQLIKELNELRLEIAELQKYKAAQPAIIECKSEESILGQNEERYRSLFQNMLGGFAYCKMLYDDKGNPDDWVYLDVNPAFERLTGLKNIVGDRVTKAIPGIKETNPELFEIYARVATTGKPEYFEFYVEPLEIWFDVSAYCPAKDHFVAVFENITGRKQSEEELQSTLNRFYTILSSLYGGMLLVTNKGVAEFANQAFCDLFDLDDPPMELHGLTAPEVIEKIKSVYADPEIWLCLALWKSLQEIER